jgi:cation:H+ antiporter
MPPIVMTSAQFVVCAAAIVFAGIRLSRYGDAIADRTGAGGTWIGLILLATVTSLPELVTGASAILLVDVVDIAVGDALGSCMFNLLILALLDALHPVPLSARIHQGHMLAAGFGIVQLGIFASAMALGPRAPSVGWIGAHSVILFAVYALAMRTIFTFERTRLAGQAEDVVDELRTRDVPLGQAAAWFAVNAVILVVAASLLPAVAGQFAEVTGLQESFVGSLFVAASTSLPEVVVSVAAVRLGAIDMAAANLLGSNLFNLALIAVDDVLYVQGPLLRSIAPSHLVTALGAMIMTGIAMIGLTVRARAKRYRLSWDATASVTVYVLTLALLASQQKV